MGYSKLSYDEYIDNIDYWNGTLGVRLPMWAYEVSRLGGIS